MRDEDLNAYRLDMDEAMRARRESIDTWRRIEADLHKGGPFSKMLVEFRRDATEAISALVYVETTDPAVKVMQATVQRCLDTMEKVDAFRHAAEAADANTEAQTALSDEDD